MQNPLPELLHVAMKEGTGCGKKQKRPKFPGKLTTRSLNLFESSDNILVNKELMQANTRTKKETKKRGRPNESRNKNPPKSQQVLEAKEACYAFLIAPPSLTATGKEKI